jgi:hypothetical protein
MKHVKVDGRHVSTVEVDDPSTVLHQIRPELTILDAETADRIDAALERRTSAPIPSHVVHPISGWGRCGKCGGSLTTSKNGSGVTKYICDRFRRFGTCAVSVKVPVDVVECAIVSALLDGPLSDPSMTELRAIVRKAMADHAAALAKEGEGAADIDGEIATLTKRKAKAIRLALTTDDDPDVVAELRAIKARLATLAAQQRAVQAAPGVDALAMRRIEAEAVKGMLARRDELRSRGTMRAALVRLFPSGLRFRPEGNGWHVTGDLVPCAFGTDGPPRADPAAGPIGHE